MASTVKRAIVVPPIELSQEAASPPRGGVQKVRRRVGSKYLLFFFRVWAISRPRPQVLDTPLFSVHRHRAETFASPKDGGQQGFLGDLPSVRFSVTRGEAKHFDFPPAQRGGVLGRLASHPSSPRLAIAATRKGQTTVVHVDVYLWLKLLVFACLASSASGLVVGSGPGSFRGGRGVAPRRPKAATLAGLGEAPQTQTPKIPSRTSRAGDGPRAYVNNRETSGGAPLKNKPGPVTVAAKSLRVTRAFGLEGAVRMERMLAAKTKDILSPMLDWQSNGFRSAVVAGAFVAYAPLADVLGSLPAPNPAEGGYFFSLMSIVYGTLTASTISDSTTRLANLRAAAVEEVTMLPPLMRRLEGTLLGGQSRELGDEAARVDAFRAAAEGILAHTDALSSGSTAAELASISDARDPLLYTVDVLQAASLDLGVDLDFALAAVERVIDARGKRLNLERSSISPEQFSVLRGLSAALVAAFAYLTLDHVGVQPSILGFSLEKGLDPSLGVHVLFSLVVGAVATFGNLAEDLNRPFTSSKVESDTIDATLAQLRDGLLPYFDADAP